MTELLPLVQTLTDTDPLQTHSSRHSVNYLLQYALFSETRPYYTTVVIFQIHRAGAKSVTGSVDLPSAMELWLKINV